MFHVLQVKLATMLCPKNVKESLLMWKITPLWEKRNNARCRVCCISCAWVWIDFETCLRSSIGSSGLLFTCFCFHLVWWVVVIETSASAVACHVTPGREPWLCIYGFSDPQLLGEDPASWEGWTDWHMQYLCVHTTWYKMPMSVLKKIHYLLLLVCRNLCNSKIQYIPSLLKWICLFFSDVSWKQSAHSCAKANDGLTASFVTNYYCTGTFSLPVSSSFHSELKRHMI